MIASILAECAIAAPLAGDEATPTKKNHPQRRNRNHQNKGRKHLEASWISQQIDDEMVSAWKNPCEAASVEFINGTDKKYNESLDAVS